MNVSQNSSVAVGIEPTPNPESMKFTVSGLVLSPEVRHFNSQSETLTSPLARKLFGFAWAKGVLIGKDFLTISKHEWVDWSVIAEPLRDLIQEHLLSGEPVMAVPISITEPDFQAEDRRGSDMRAAPSEDAPIEERIRHLIETEIRPAVAMDGGDVAFSHFEAGRVYLKMLGSCSGCPSSTYTLKEGIETRMREAIAEVIEVIGI